MMDRNELAVRVIYRTAKLVASVNPERQSIVTAIALNAIYEYVTDKRTDFAKSVRWILESLPVPTDHKVMCELNLLNYELGRLEDGENIASSVVVRLAKFKQAYAESLNR